MNTSQSLRLVRPGSSACAAGSRGGRIKEDMRVFREYTMGRVVVCGPKTFASMGPLKGRTVMCALPLYHIAPEVKRSQGAPLLEYYPQGFHRDESAPMERQVACVGGLLLLQPGIQWRAFSELIVSRIHGGPFECDARMDWDFPGYECYSEEPISERVALTKWRRK